jgi:phosphomannomutase
VTIAFGTDGWRAVVGDGYTFANVERAAQALADLLDRRNAEGAVLVGYDRRFLSERFADRAAEVIAASGRRTLLFDRAAPTPVVSFEIARAGHAAGVCITASHNPASFNGFKIKEQPGRSAAPATVREVEALVDATPPRRAAPDAIERVAPPAEYDAAVASLVDLDALRSASVTVVADAMHGAAELAFERFLGGGALRVVTIRAGRDAYFGGVNPEPIAPNLAALAAAVRAEGAVLGLANDGDADRLGAVDERGEFITSQVALAILVRHLAGRRGERGTVVKTVSQSRIIDRMAADFGLDVRETPIGFKYVADEILRGDVLIGGEESGGFGFRGFIPERDGVLAGLLLAEAVQAAGLAPSALEAEIQARYGPLFYDRRDMRVAPAVGLELVAGVAADPPERLAGEAVVGVSTVDGTKLTLADESWLLLRQSGTEPALRVYSEATSEAKRDALLDAGVDVVRRGL